MDYTFTQHIFLEIDKYSRLKIFSRKTRGERSTPLKISKEKILFAVAAACAAGLLTAIHFHVQNSTLTYSLGITGNVSLLVALCLQVRRWASRSWDASFFSPKICAGAGVLITELIQQFRPVIFLQKNWTSLYGVQTLIFAILLSRDKSLKEIYLFPFLRNIHKMFLQLYMYTSLFRKNPAIL